MNQYRNLGRIVGSAYLGLLDAGLDPSTSTAIVVMWMKELGRQNPEEVIEDTIRRIEAEERES